MLKKLMKWIEDGDRRQARLMSEAGVISVWTYQQGKARKAGCRCKDCKCEKKGEVQK